MNMYSMGFLVSLATGKLKLSTYTASMIGSLTYRHADIYIGGKDARGTERKDETRKFRKEHRRG